MNKINTKRLCFMVDCSRNAVMKVETIKSWIDICKDLGFTSLMIYTEDTYEVEGHPYFGYARGRYTKDEMREMDAYANERGIEIIPFIQTLAHIEQIFRWSDYRSLCDYDDILLCDDEGTYKLIDSMFKTLAECFTSRIVNVGMDEAGMIGRGRYYDLKGHADHREILLKHTERVAKIAKKHGFDICMWSDMFFHFATGERSYFNPDANIDGAVGELIPDNASLIYWDYYKREQKDYTGMIKAHEKIKKGCWYAGGIWTWDGFSTQNKYSIEALKNNLNSCRECGVENIIITTWGDGGAECSAYEALPSLFFASEYVKGNDDMEDIKSRFAKRFGISFDSFMLFDQVMRNESDAYYLSPSKYLLYNDPFIGLADAAVPDGCREDFLELTALTAPLVNDGKWGYLFDTCNKLCRAVAAKCDVGIRIRSAYKRADSSELMRLANELREIEGQIREFYLAFEKQWMLENKAYGLEIHDVRLGGLMTRILHCADRLEKYANGLSDSIEELENDTLDPKGTRDCMDHGKKYIRFNRWSEIVTAGNLAISR